MKRVILFGAPGAGKGTQADALQKEFGYTKISTGDLIRAEFVAGTTLGAQMEAMISRGEFVPDTIIMEMLSKRLQQSDVTTGYILDGFPRTLAQGKALNAIVADDEIAFYLKIGNEDIVVKRVLARLTCSTCGAIYRSTVVPPNERACAVCDGVAKPRTDDTETVVRKRVGIYRKETKPVIQYYRNEKELHEINGAQGINEVFQAIKGVLN